MLPENDPNMFIKLLDWAWAGVLVMLGVIWRKHNEEIASLKSAIENKATIQEMTRQRDNVEELFKAQVDIRHEMADNHKEIMAAVGTLGAQIAHINGKLEQ